MRSSSGKKPSSASAIKAIDARSSKAGLVRSQRGQSTLHSGAVHMERETPEELTSPAPIPRRAANGVEWLPVPGWNFSWLWSGFSTRRGGLSRAYCAQTSCAVGAPGLPAVAGELNLVATHALQHLVHPDCETACTAAWPRG